MRIDYIFLEKKKDIKENTVIINTGNNSEFIIRHVNNAFDVTKNSFKIKINDIDCLFSYSISNFPNKSYDHCFVYYMTLSIDTERPKKCAELLECINKRLLCAENKKKFNIIHAYDGVSEYYCEKAYKTINQIERQVRRLIYTLLTKEFGTNWLEITPTSSKTKNAAKSIMQNAKEHNSSDALIERALYFVDISTLEYLLFEPYRDITQKDIENILDIEMSDENLVNLSKDQIAEIIKKSRCKTVWQQCFSGIMDISIMQNYISDFRILRNKVAHARFFYKKDYADIKKIQKKLSPILDQAIENAITEKHSFDLQGMSNALGTLGLAISKIISYQMPDIVSNLSFVAQSMASTITSLYDSINFEGISDGLSDFAQVVGELYTSSYQGLSDNLQLLNTTDGESDDLDTKNSINEEDSPND